MSVIFGCDSEIAAIRDKLPEPSRTELPIMCGLRIPKTPFLFTDEVPDMCFAPHKKVEFRKQRVREPGMEYVAWVCVEDGAVYF